MKLALRSALAASVLALAACSQAGAGDPSKAEIEEIVRAYILENPEIIREALIELDRLEQQAELDRSRDAIADLSDQIFRDPRDYAVGPKDAKVQVVEFFDYNCGYCKRSTDFIQETVDKYPDDVRIVFKELPVLTGPDGTSYIAAQAALAAARQGKYNKMHFALMGERALTKDRILKVARDNGIDADKLATDMESAEIKRQIQDNLALANRIPALTGTPFFIVNDQFVNGGYTDRVQGFIEDELKG